MNIRIWIIGVYVTLLVCCLILNHRIEALNKRIKELEYNQWIISVSNDKVAIQTMDH